MSKLTSHPTSDNLHRFPEAEAHPPCGISTCYQDVSGCIKTRGQLIKLARSKDSVMALRKAWMPATLMWQPSCADFSWASEIRTEERKVILQGLGKNWIRTRTNPGRRISFELVKLHILYHVVTCPACSNFRLMKYATPGSCTDGKKHRQTGQRAWPVENQDVHTVVLQRT